MLQTGLLYWQFPQEYFISPFGLALSVLPKLGEEPDQPLPRVAGGMTVNEIACFALGAGVPKYISFSKCFWKDLFVVTLSAI